MKRLILLFSVFCIICACNTVKGGIVEKSTTTSTSLQKISGSDRKENTQGNKIDFDFLSFEIGYNEAESQITANNLYQIKYRPVLEFINGNNNFTVDYEILDINNKELIARKNIKPKNEEDNLFVIRDEFSNLFNINFFRYHVVVHINGADEEYVGEYNIDNGVKIESLESGPIITRSENDTLVTYLTIKSTLIMNGLLQWIRLIPPSEDSFWEIPYEKEGYTINAYAVLNDTKHKRYIDNGEYIFQVNVGRQGILQRSIKIVDFFSNTSGANYGLPVAAELENDKNKVVLDLNFQEKIDKMEIHLYTDVEGSLQKIGIAKPMSVSSVLQKKDIIKLFADDYGNKIKIKNNKKYYYQIYLYSKEFNELEYVSVSEMIPIVFQGFSLW